MGLPAVALTGEGFGRPEHGAFLGRTTAPRTRRRLGEVVELAGHEHPGHHMDRGRQLAQVLLGGIAAIAQHPEAALRQLGRHKVHDFAGQGTARLIRHLQLVRLRHFEVEGQADRDTKRVRGPQRQRHPHDAPHKI